MCGVQWEQQWHVGPRYGDFVEEEGIVAVYYGSWLKDDHENFFINGKNDEVVSVMTTYISREIHFHISGLDCPNEVWKKLKKLLDMVDERQVMQLEKELISLDSWTSLFQQDWGLFGLC